MTICLLGRMLPDRVVYSMLPSSAPAERVFSLLQASTSSQQQRVLADHLEAACKISSATPTFYQVTAMLSGSICHLLLEAIGYAASVHHFQSLHDMHAA